MENLSHRLRTETRELHEWVEDHPFNQDLFSGRLSMTRYGRYLTGLHAVATSMETSLASLEEDSPLSELVYPVLYRSEALAEDRLHFPPAEGPVPELASFLTEPVDLTKLAAMCYVRWMGDLGGGQIIVRILSEAWNLKRGTGSGLSFYHFSEPVGQLRQGLRDALDSIPFSPEEQDQTVLAARQIFELHEAWFSSLV